MYVLYLVAIGWFVLPAYGTALSQVLPSDAPMFDRWLDIVAAASGVAALWWGVQGGPLTVSRAAVVYELGSPTSRIKVLLPMLLRQAIIAGSIAALAGTLLLGINGGTVNGLAAPAWASAVCGLAIIGAVFQAAIWLVVIHARGVPTWVRATIGIIGVTLALSVVAFVANGNTLSSGPGLGLLALVVVTGGCVGMAALRWAPVDTLWRRASALDAMRSSMQTFDFQRALLDLRSAGDQPQPGAVRLARAWMPLPLWRQLATMQHGLAKRLARLAAATASLAAILFLADARDGLILLAVAGCSGVIAFEFSGSLAATADQSVFLVHYRRGSRHVLRAQLATMLGLSVCVGALAVGWQWSSSSAEALAALLLCGFGALAAALQARLGSPNLGAYVDTVFGDGAIGVLLWARAMLGPAVLFIGTVAVSHLLLRPAAEGDSVWEVVALVTAAAAATVVTWPLETRRQ